jgi:hypothetical protein
VVLRSPRVLRAGDCVLAIALFYRSPNSESVVTRSEKLFRRGGETSRRHAGATHDGVGRNAGVGRGRGVTPDLGVGVGRGVAVAVPEGVGVELGVAVGVAPGVTVGLLRDGVKAYTLLSAAK